MSDTIRLRPPSAGSSDPLRPNLFPGRALGERELELLQAFVDARIAPLATRLPPGIVSGLEVRVAGGGADTRMRILPGLGIGRGGQLVQLFQPLDLAWPAFAEAVERAQDGPLRDGLYHLTVSSTVQPIDDAGLTPPCTRTEPDPARIRRLEAVTLPGLRLVEPNPRLLAMAQARAANLVCASFLERSPFDPATGEVPVALVKVTSRRPDWIDAVAGRYLAEPDAPYRTFLAHAVTVWRAWSAGQGAGAPAPASDRSLLDLLGIEQLPAAGPFAPALVGDVAAVAPLHGDTAGQPPPLRFAPRDLQVELVPVPASTVGAALARELPRGTVDLVGGRGDRIRLLLAIPDLSYRKDLLDLPQPDTLLEDALFRREQAAAAAWRLWREQWEAIFGQASVDDLRRELAPEVVLRPASAAQYRRGIAAARRDEVGGSDALTPEPWHTALVDPRPAPEDVTAVSDPRLGADGLVHRRAALRARVADLEKDLDESYRLLNEVNDYLGLQRQQLDSIGITFTALAGGTAGDGSGLNLVRWSKAAAFLPEKKEVP